MPISRASFQVFLEKAGKEFRVKIDWSDVKIFGQNLVYGFKLFTINRIAVRYQQITGKLFNRQNTVFFEKTFRKKFEQRAVNIRNTASVLNKNRVSL